MARNVETALLRRLIVVRRDLQRAVRAAFSAAIVSNRFIGGIPARAGEHWTLPAGEFDGQFDDVDVFLEAEFGDRPWCRRDDAIHAAFDLHPDKALEASSSTLPSLNGRGPSRR